MRKKDNVSQIQFKQEPISRNKSIK